MQRIAGSKGQDASRLVVTETGIGPGTSVLTADGMIPVEFLSPGDRVVTRAGMRTLRRLSFRLHNGPVVCIRAGTLGYDRPDRDLTVAEGQPVRIADWRAQALWGKREAIVPIARLIDGTHVARADVADLRLFTLHFDRPEVFHADGVECLSGVPVPAMA
jgi:hypothetical protein